MDTSGFVIYRLWLLMLLFPTSPVSLWVNATMCTEARAPASPSHAQKMLKHTHKQDGSRLSGKCHALPLLTAFRATSWLPWQLDVCICVYVGTVSRNVKRAWRAANARAHTEQTHTHRE